MRHFLPQASIHTAKNITNASPAPARWRKEHPNDETCHSSLLRKGYYERPTISRLGFSQCIPDSWDNAGSVDYLEVAKGDEMKKFFLFVSLYLQVTVAVRFVIGYFDASLDLSDDIIVRLSLSVVFFILGIFWPNRKETK